MLIQAGLSIIWPGAVAPSSPPPLLIHLRLHPKLLIGLSHGESAHLASAIGHFHSCPLFWVQKRVTFPFYFSFLSYTDQKLTRFPDTGFSQTFSEAPPSSFCHPAAAHSLVLEHPITGEKTRLGTQISIFSRYCKQHYEFSFKSYKTCVYDKALKSFISPSL